MTYRTEFPDFDPATMPAIPAEWRDASWHNDTCPSFMIGQEDRPTLQIFVDYLKPEDREFRDRPRFSILGERAIDADGGSLASDDWSEILAFVKAALNP